jgi:hypothetical protein
MNLLRSPSMKNNSINKIPSENSGKSNEKAFYHGFLDGQSIAEYSEEEDDNEQIGRKKHSRYGAYDEED